ncbi:hypothetical protein J3R82DRAFT_5216 [Butyriboletus roseoflavus]|nr:hypothetical protein J3R82DRAFT_5216 [Butyriboletus roseoflavus]
MTESNQTPTVPLSVSKENKRKNFYEHGKDALGLALSVAKMQEENALRKAEKHHHQVTELLRSGFSQRQSAHYQLSSAGWQVSRCAEQSGSCEREQKATGKSPDGELRPHLFYSCSQEEAKVVIAKRRAEAKKEKARSRKKSKSRLRNHDDAKITAPEDTTAPRKRVSFA